MSRRLSLSLSFLCCLVGAPLAGCHHEPAAHHAKPGEYPPLPPASGTPVGYIVDAATDLKLRDDQLLKLKDLDAKLAAQDDEIDTQLRQVEKPPEPEEGQKPQHAPTQRGRRGAHHAGGGGGAGKGSPEALKLHEMQDANDRAALKQAFAILDDAQRVETRKLLLDHSVEPPDEPTAPKPVPTAPTPDGPTPGQAGNIPGSDVPAEP